MCRGPSTLLIWNQVEQQHEGGPCVPAQPLCNVARIHTQSVFAKPSGASLLVSHKLASRANLPSTQTNFFQKHMANAFRRALEGASRISSELACGAFSNTLLGEEQ